MVMQNSLETNYVRLKNRYNFRAEGSSGLSIIKNLVHSECIRTFFSNIIIFKVIFYTVYDSMSIFLYIVFFVCMLSGYEPK